MSSARQPHQDSPRGSLQEPVFRQETRAGGDQLRRLRQGDPRQRQRIGARIGQGLDGSERRGRTPPGHKEAATGARFDDATRYQPIVRIDEGEGACPYEPGELADGRQPSPGGQLSVVDELGDALGDLVDQWNGGLARQFEQGGAPEAKTTHENE